MFSKELENLIQATIADGKLTEKEKAALVKRAQNEGVDLDELEIYIDSLMQQRAQESYVQIEKETVSHEKLRKGNVCPHCNTPIPPMTKICPECGRAVNANETSGDKELHEMVNKIGIALIKMKSSDDNESFKKAKAECEVLIKQADLFYGTDKKIQMLLVELKDEIKLAQNKIATLERKRGLIKVLTSGVFWIIMEVIVCFSLYSYFSKSQEAAYEAYQDAEGRSRTSEWNAVENAETNMVLSVLFGIVAVGGTAYITIKKKK